MRIWRSEHPVVTREGPKVQDSSKVNSGVELCAIELLVDFSAGKNQLLQMYIYLDRLTEHVAPSTNHHFPAKRCHSTLGCAYS